MITSLSFTDSTCQLESRVPCSPDWAKLENLDYCEDFNALVSVKKSSGFIAKLRSILFSVIG